MSELLAALAGFGAGVVVGVVVLLVYILYGED